MTEQELQQVRARALADGDRAALYQADRELAQIAEYGEWYRKRWADRPIHR